MYTRTEVHPYSYNSIDKMNTIKTKLIKLKSYSNKLKRENYAVGENKSL